MLSPPPSPLKRLLSNRKYQANTLWSVLLFDDPGLSCFNLTEAAPHYVPHTVYITTTRTVSASLFTDSLFSLQVIKYNPQVIYWPPAQGGSLYFSFSRSALESLVSSPMFLKRTKRKIKQRLFTGYVSARGVCLGWNKTHHSTQKTNLKTNVQPLARVDS